MKAAIVLLADSPTQNFARRVAVEMSISRQVEFFAALLPSHVSLKQPFEFESLDTLDRYTENLAARIQPFTIRLDSFYTAEWDGYGILGLNVVETPELRGLHNQVNHELSQIFKDSQAAHDGGGYHFHLTIEMGKVSGINPFREYFDSLTSPTVDLSFQVRELGVFFYNAEPYVPGSFTVYRVLPLGGASSRVYAT
jgi:2'-5' RNA ligase